MPRPVDHGGGTAADNGLVLALADRRHQDQRMREIAGFDARQVGCTQFLSRREEAGVNALRLELMEGPNDTLAIIGADRSDQHRSAVLERHHASVSIRTGSFAHAVTLPSADVELDDAARKLPRPWRRAGY